MWGGVALFAVSLTRWLRTYYDPELQQMVETGRAGEAEKILSQGLRGAAIPGHTSFESEGVEYDGEWVPAHRFIRLFDCGGWLPLKKFIERMEGQWEWSAHAGPIDYPKSILFRSRDCRLSQREIYHHAQSNTDFGRLTSPDQRDPLWDRLLHLYFVEPVRMLVSSIDEEQNPDIASDVLVPFSIQLLRYEEGKGGFEKGSHFDPKAYEYIATYNILGKATIELGSNPVIWSQPVGDGEIYLLRGPAVKEWKHRVKCHSSPKRIAAVLRFVRESSLEPLIEKVAGGRAT